MKYTTILKSSVITTLSLSLIAGSALAKKPYKRKHLKKNEGKNGAIKEERILDKKDTHGAQREAGKDKRPKNIHSYHKQSFKRIKALLKSGQITEDQGTIYKTTQTDITRLITIAKADGEISKAEKTEIRADLDQLNDNLTIIADEAEKGEERTPLLNKRQHKLEEAVEAGIRSGRLSTLEANGIKRKLARLARLEDKLKKDAKVSQREREKLFKEVGEIRRDIKKELRD